MTSTIQPTTAKVLETVAVNIRYGLAKRGFHNYEALVRLLDVTDDHAINVYSGRASYTVGDLGKLAAYFGVEPSRLLNENLTVGVRDVDGLAIKCTDTSCDTYGGLHTGYQHLDPIVHKINFSFVQLSRVEEPGDPWKVYLTAPEEAYTEGQLSRLIADATAARALMRDLNAGIVPENRGGH